MRFQKLFLFSLLLLGLLVGCLKTSDSNGNPFTANRLRFNHGPVIAMLHQPRGLYSYPLGSVPEVIVYEDGTLILAVFDYANGTEELFQSRMNSAEICTLFHQIESTDFFSFRQSDYIDPGITGYGISSTTISINGPRSNSITAYALDHYVQSDDIHAPKMQPLVDTKAILQSLSQKNTTPYRPQRIAVSLADEHSTTGTAAPLWPLTSPSLAQLNVNHNPSLYSHGETYVVLRGKQADAVFEQFGNRYTQDFTDGTTTFTVNIKPLLPRQSEPRPNSWQDLPTFISLPPSFDCPEPSLFTQFPLFTQPPQINILGDSTESPSYLNFLRRR